MLYYPFIVPSFMNRAFLYKILTWGAFLAPLTLFIFRQHTVYPLVFLKASIFEIFIAVLAPIWLALILKFPEYRPRLTKIHAAIGLWVAALVLAAIFGVNVSRSFWSSQDRTTGIIFIICAIIYALILETVVKEQGWRKMMQFFAAIGGTMIAMALVNRYAPGFFYSIVGARPSGTLGNPSFLAGYLLLTMGITAWLFASAPQDQSNRKTRFSLGLTLLGICVAGMLLMRALGVDDVFNSIALGVGSFGLFYVLESLELISPRLGYRAILAILFIANLVVLLFANTRGALLGLALGILFLLVWFFKEQWKQQRSIRGAAFSLPGILITLLIIGGAIFIATRTAPFWQAIPGFDRLAKISFSDTTVNNRRLVWNIALTSFTERPLLGWGSENFRYAFDLHYNPILLGTASDESYWDKPHNALLESLVTTGIVGFLAYMGIFYAAFILLRKRNDFSPFGAAALLAYLAQNFVIFDSFATYLLLFVILIRIADFDTSAQVIHLSDSKILRYTTISLLAVGSLYVISMASIAIYANTLQYKGLNYFVNRLPEEAIEAYSKGFKLFYPYSAELRQSYMAALKQMIGQANFSDVRAAIDLALKEYPKAIAKDPRNHFLYFTIADARTVFFRVDKQYIQGAEYEIDQADLRSPNRQQTNYVRARLRVAAGDLAGGIKEMKKAIDLSPKVGEPHFYHALLNVGTATIDEINRELVMALDYGYEPKNTQELKLAYQYFVNNEQYALGSDYFGELNPDPVLKLDVDLYHGGLAFKAGQYDVAMSVFQKIKMEHPEVIGTYRFTPEFKDMFAALGLITVQ